MNNRERQLLFEEVSQLFGQLSSAYHQLADSGFNGGDSEKAALRDLTKISAKWDANREMVNAAVRDLDSQPSQPEKPVEPSVPSQEAPDDVPAPNPTPAPLPDNFDPAHYYGDPNDPDPMHHRPRPDGINVPTPDPVVTVPNTEPVPVPVPNASGDITQPIQNLGRANWIGDWLGQDPFDFVRSVTRETVMQNKTPVFIGYAVPGRDNGNYSAGGFKDFNVFGSFYRGIAEGVGNEPAMVVVEPDAMALYSNLDDTKKAERVAGIQKAIDFLNEKPNISIFLDMGHWIDAQEAARRLLMFKNIDGFSINVSGWLKTEEQIEWAEKISELTGLKYIVDTSRNGRGNPHAPMWCNVTDTLVGQPPTNKTHSRNCLFYFWGKVPGESDGKGINDDGSRPRDDVPNAGVWWPEFADAIYSGNWDPFKAKYGV